MWMRDNPLDTNNLKATGKWHSNVSAASRLLPPNFFKPRTDQKLSRMYALTYLHQLRNTTQILHNTAMADSVTIANATEMAFRIFREISTSICDMLLTDEDRLMFRHGGLEECIAHVYEHKRLLSTEDALSWWKAYKLHRTMDMTMSDCTGDKIRDGIIVLKKDAIEHIVLDAAARMLNRFSNIEVRL